MSDNKVAVTFSVPHTTFDGKEHKADATVKLDPVEANEVILVGHGRYADDAPTSTTGSRA
jgi:hypothetical protein